MRRWPWARTRRFDRAFGGADTWATSSTLASAVKKLPYDLIITGRQAIDGDTAQVGPQISEHLGLVNISYAEKITVKGEYVEVQRQYEDRYHVIKAKMPCLITALAELTRPDLDVEDGNIGLKGSPTRVFKSFTKALKGKGTVVNLDAQESVDFLVEKLHEKFIL